MRRVCDEFKWLLEQQGTFWEAVPNALITLEQHRIQEREILRQIARFIEAEEAIFAQLRISGSKAASILGDAYGTGGRRNCISSVVARNSSGGVLLGESKEHKTNAGRVDDKGWKLHNSPVIDCLVVRHPTQVPSHESEKRSPGEGQTLRSSITTVPDRRELSQPATTAPSDIRCLRDLGCGLSY
jgi:hypothetical protein